MKLRANKYLPILLSIVCSLLISSSFLSIIELTPQQLNSTESQKLANGSEEIDIQNEHMIKAEDDTEIDDATLPNELQKELEIDTNNKELLNNLNEHSYSDARSSRDLFNENEGNNDFGSANDITGTSTPHTIRGTVSPANPSDVDFFKIKLEGGNKSVDNLTVTINSLDSTGYMGYHEFFIAIYGHYEDDYDDEYLLMKVVSCRPDQWAECPAAIINAFNSGYYYLRISVTSSYVWYDDPVDYNLKLDIQQVTPDDNNQKKIYAEKISESGKKGKVIQNTDLFDWYYIDAEDPDNYDTNFSFSIDLTASKGMNSDTEHHTYVPELYVIIQYTNYKGDHEENKLAGNIYRKYDQKDPITFFKHYDDRGSILRFYIGLYVQTYGKTSSGDGAFIAGDGYCDGWIEYTIKQIQAKPMIPPLLNNSLVQAPIGKIYDSFLYKVNYSDENNDPPKLITITIDKGDIGPAVMTKLDESDKNYQDGCIYKFYVDGADFDPNDEEHEYKIFAEDVEVKANIISGIGPIITNNILPRPRPSAISSYSINEDDSVSYIDMNETFEDPDNHSLFFRLSKNNKDWSKIYNSENITIKVVTLETEEGENQFLEFKPKKDKFNRRFGEQFGSEILYVNVSDKDPDSNEELNRAHYMWEPYELEVIIIDVNDPPQIKSRFCTLYPNCELILEEDQMYRDLDLNSVFWDPVENDPLTYSVIENKNIDVEIFTNGTIKIIPHENWTGTEALQFVANDGEATVSDTLKVTITPVNDNPFLNYTPKQIIYEDEWFNITFIGFDLADNEPVYFETDLYYVLGLSEDEYLFDPESGELSFKPNNKNVRTYKNITVTVKDYHDGATEQIIVFEIRNKPDPPEPLIISPEPDDKYLKAENIYFQGNFYDPDDVIHLEMHNFAWYSSIDGLIGNERNFTTILSVGEHKITLEVLDPLLNGTTFIEIRVLGETMDDFDEDGIPDYWEILHSLNEKNPHDAEEDMDGDQYTNLEEYLGIDGKSGGNDDTDPWNRNEHPTKHFEKSKKTGDSILTTVLLMILIFIIIIVFLFVSLTLIRRKRRIAEAEEETAKAKAKEEEARTWRDMFGRKYEVYQYQPIDIVCHNCLEKQEVQLPIRPLAVTCRKCGKRGVLYK